MKIYSEFFIGFPEKEKEKRDREEPSFRISFFRPSFLFLPAVAAVRGSALLCCLPLSTPFQPLFLSVFSFSCWTDGKQIIKPSSIYHPKLRSFLVSGMVFLLKVLIFISFLIGFGNGFFSNWDVTHWFLLI